MMDRRVFLQSLALPILGGPAAAQAQQAGRVYRLGSLTSAPPPDPAEPGSIILISRVLGDLGYREGQNLTIEYRFAGGHLDRLPGLARELVAARPDVILAITHSAVEAARQATATLPIVMFAVADPVALGWIASLARPGGNLTGIVIEPDTLLIDKRLQLLRELVPRARKIGFLTTAEPQVQDQARGARRAATAMGLTLLVAEAQDRDYDRAFARMTAERAHALLVPASGVLNRDRARIIELCARHRLPAMYQWRESVDRGGLMAYGSSITALSRRAAAYIDRIFRGANPAELPVEQPTTYELVINQATARALGLTIPPSMLIRADHVVGR